MKAEEDRILRIIRTGTPEQVAELKKEYMELLSSTQALNQYPKAER